MGSPIVPCLHYDNPNSAVAWLVSAFGFHEHSVHRDGKGNIVHAELTIGDGMIMIGPKSPTEFGKLIKQPNEIGYCESQICFIFVADAAAHFEKAKQQGAEIVMPLEKKDYGASDYVCCDPEGHIWSFGDYDPWKKPTT